MISTDLSKSTSRITLKKFKEIKARVDKYLNEGGKANSTSVYVLITQTHQHISIFTIKIC